MSDLFAYLSRTHALDEAYAEIERTMVNYDVDLLEALSIIYSYWHDQKGCLMKAVIY